MPILHSYYQDVYRCPIVRLDGYSAQHGLSTGILAPPMAVMRTTVANPSA